MRYISIEDAKPGMCLAYDLYDSLGRTVIGRGCELTASYISRLAEYGFCGVYIDDELSNDIHVEPSISEALRTEGMKSHARRSYELLSGRWDISAHVKQTVLFHHENVDGSGYPQGLTGAEQSIFVRILHVADVYDALTSKRPYKKPYSPYEAAEYLMGACGIMFDKQVVQVFLQYVPLYPKGTKVRLSDGRVALIYDNTGIHNLRPILLFEDGKKLDLLEYASLNITILPPEGREMGSPQSDEADRAKMIRKPKKIMIVDDSSTNREVLKKILEKYYSLVFCKSGEQALFYLRRNAFPDLMIMDIDMPTMSGIQATIKANKITGGTVPVLFVSEVSDSKTVKTCRELHAAGYVLRPYKPIFVKSEIDRILNGWRA